MWMLMGTLAWGQGTSTPEEPDETIEDERVPTQVLPVVRRKSRLTKNGVLLSFGAAYGAYLGAETGYLVSEAVGASDPGGAIALGLLGGGATGVTTAFLLSRVTESRPEAQMMLYTGSLHGVFYGTQLGRALIPRDAESRDARIHAAGLAGSMMGIGVGTALGRVAPTAADQARLTLATGVGWVTATGLNDLAYAGRVDLRDNPGARAAATVGVASAFTGLGLLANHVGARPGVAAISTNLTHGAWLGVFSPLVFGQDLEAGQVTGGLRLGLGLGYGGALVNSAFGEPSPRSVGMQSMGFVAGSALGAGIPLAANDDSPQAAIGAMLLGGIGGRVLGGVIAPRYRLESNDRVLLTGLTAWSTYQALGWGLYASQVSDAPRVPLGVALITGGTGTLLTFGLAPALDMAPSGSVMMVTGGAWGTWYGAWSAALAQRASAGQVWPGALIAGNVALVGTGVAQAVGWRPQWREVALINGLGLVGAAAGGLTGVVLLFDPDDTRPLVASTLTGSTLGLAAGAVLSALPRKKAARKRDGVSMRMPGWQASVAASPLMGEDGIPGAMLQVNLNEVGR